MVRPTIQIGDPRLKAKNSPITDFSSSQLQQLIKDLTDTMLDAGLIGIAAPQIAENFQLFITEPRQTETRPADQADELRIYINPKIVKYSQEHVVIYEGCGSVLNGQLFGPVKRPSVVTIEAYDQHANKFQFIADGILGRVIQHEYDHLQGIEFTEKVEDYKKLMHKDFYVQNIRNSPEQIQASKITHKEFKYIS